MSEQNNRYKKETKNGLWKIVNDKVVFEETVLCFEHDIRLNEWIKTKEETVLKNPESLGWAKSINAIVVFPDTNEQLKQFGKKSAKKPQLYMLSVQVKVKDDMPFTYLKCEKNLTGRDEKVSNYGKTEIYVRNFQFGYGYILSDLNSGNDDNIIIRASEETETSLEQLREIESKGIPILFFNKVEWNPNLEKFEFAKDVSRGI